MIRAKGIVLIITGAMLWGATGPLMEWILSHSRISVPFMLTIRLLIAGIGLLAFLKISGKQLTPIWRQPYWLKRLVIFALFGMLGVQYSFVAAIESSNAVVATLLQFLAPIFVVIFVSWSIKKWPPKYQLYGIFGTLLGLFFLLTNGSFNKLLLSPEALAWGVAVGLSFAFYTLYPSALMKEWGVLFVVGWSMLIGGVVLGSLSHVWKSDEWTLLLDWKLSILVLTVIVFGTVAFVLFLSSMKYISAIETSILSSMEPLTAMIISVIWLQQVLGVWQMVGALLMLVCVTWLSIAGDRNKKEV
ncbi:DMT family transporter [Paenisporosarcina quisquiliarum]|uniref:DMT family transporter n=1 Tax=Paenisporosarcina quisquiliarum TaxID=365346 RepID=A0A9X3LIK2_9BACL|nr:DMT family transporter [Paenisporosarcina quisquiliarum]MCZ8538045.1 DMT family transporter [Paenisporosarcina quisquiliarum]